LPQLLVIGVDEAGRGPWAGPVTAAAVALGAQVSQEFLTSVRDSKALNSKRREALVPLIKSHAWAWGIGWSDVNEIDKLGIHRATFFAMQRAVLQLLSTSTHRKMTLESAAAKAALAASSFNGKEVHVIVDGNLHPARYIGEDHWPWVTETMIKADARQIEVAASSILAKTARDSYMLDLATDYPGYGFEFHAGYGTKQHQEALRLLGPAAPHRKSFRPIRELLVSSNDAT
jgi:ribonuclease HII